VVDPEKLIEKYGADTARLFCLFAAPPEKDLEWNDRGVEGCYRFLQRVWRLVSDNRELLQQAAPAGWQDQAAAEVKALRRKTHQTIRKVTDDIETRFHFNTAISAVMELVNQLYQADAAATAGSPAMAAAFREAVEMTVLLLSPMVPHICEELWRQLGHQQSIMRAAWPSCDPEAARAEEQEIVIQVNGKVRGRVMAGVDASADEVQREALACPQVQPWIQGRQVRKVIVVPGKLVSIVAG